MGTLFCLVTQARRKGLSRGASTSSIKTPPKKKKKEEKKRRRKKKIVSMTRKLGRFFLTRKKGCKTPVMIFLARSGLKIDVLKQQSTEADRRDRRMVSGDRGKFGLFLSVSRSCQNHSE